MRRESIDTDHGRFDVPAFYMWPLRLGRWSPRKLAKIICRVRGHRTHLEQMILGTYRCCERCGHMEHIGPYPEIKVEFGSMRP